jgi:hypothetical protein
MGKRAKRTAEKRERKLASGALVRFPWHAREVVVKKAVADALADLPAIVSAAAAAELDVAVSIATVYGTDTAHFQFNGWVTGRRRMDWWPGNGTWIIPGTGERGKAEGWREAVGVAASRDPAARTDGG